MRSHLKSCSKPRSLQAPKVASLVVIHLAMAIRPNRPENELEEADFHHHCMEMGSGVVPPKSEDSAFQNLDMENELDCSEISSELWRCEISKRT
jgi:hypothetical protein